MEIEERIAALKQRMQQHHVDAYIVPSDDAHGSEYVSAHDKARAYMSGFTGSAGTFAIVGDEALLWTDGRYFLQAEEQLAGTPVRLMKSGQPDVPTVEQYVCGHLPEGGRIGFDGRVLTGYAAERLAKAATDKQLVLVDCPDLVGQIWTDRPDVSKVPVRALPEALTGTSRRQKLRCVRREMRLQKSDVLVLSALDEIAWLLNLRGGDVAYTPVFLAYMILTKDSAELFLHEDIVSGEICRELARDDVSLVAYDAFYAHLKMLPKRARIWYDSGSANYRLIGSLPAGADKLDKQSPIVMMKAVKTEQEIANMRAAHVKDGVAVTRFMHWLKTHVGTERITELSAAEKLLSFRRQMEGFLEESFSPIIGYGAHGAIVHYEATPATDVQMKPEGLCLSDTGGHYMEGTTDITRTIVLGPLTEEEKSAFTLVLKGQLQLGAARFLSGVSGASLDCLAREPLWAHGLDYNHGTGHGVGYMLSVHEGPHRIHWNASKESARTALQPGMIVSNEPGLYVTGKFGVRHENLVLCTEDVQNAYGQFLRFETLTMVPFDLDGIDRTLMTQADIGRLNDYHAKVYETLAPYMESDELIWLRAYTRAISERDEEEKHESV